MNRSFRRIVALSAVSLSVIALAQLPAFAESVPVPAATSVPVPVPAPTAIRAPAAAAADWGSFGVQTQWIDPATKPGDDFNRYVNGKWIDQTEIPADRSRYGAFDQLDQMSEARVHAILEELATSKPAPGSNESRVAAAYAAFLDTAAIERAGLAPARPALRKIAGVKTRSQLVALFAAPGFASPLGTSIDTDAKAPDRYLLEISQAGLGLPDRDYYLVDNPRNLQIRAKYLELMTFLLGQAGYRQPGQAAQAALALETRLAGAMWDRTTRRNRDLRYNKLTTAEVVALPQGRILADFVARLGAAQAGEINVDQLPPTAEEFAAARFTPEAAAKLGGGVPATLQVIADAPLTSWQAWLVTRFLSARAAVLPRPIDDANFAFYGTFLNGQPQQRVRWKRAIDAVEGQVGELLGEVYTARYFPPANKAGMADLVGNLRKAMATNLGELTWMGPATRVEAQAKLDAFTPKIGAPETFKRYDGLAISPENPLANAIAAEDWAWKYEVGKLGKPIERGEWFMLPQTVNAYYNSNFNEIVFPAAILQPPFFNVSADPAVNYGGIGAVIGHEMGHGFDDQGAKSDGTGALRDWWTAADKTRFEALQAKLGAQYGAYCPFDDGKTCINPELTMGENIGDLGGLSLAYRAYRMSLNGKEAPVIDGFTGDQRFFLGWAQVWRSQAREAAARQLLLTDPHSPPEARINAIVRNFDEWVRAFDVKPGDKLYLPPEQRVRIW
jgi:putative endopeptidase